LLFLNLKNLGQIIQSNLSRNKDFRPQVGMILKQIREITATAKPYQECANGRFGTFFSLGLDLIALVSVDSVRAIERKCVTFAWRPGCLLVYLCSIQCQMPIFLKMLSRWKLRKMNHF